MGEILLFGWTVPLRCDRVSLDLGKKGVWQTFSPTLCHRGVRSAWTRPTVRRLCRRLTGQRFQRMAARVHAPSIPVPNAPGSPHPWEHHVAAALTPSKTQCHFEMYLFIYFYLVSCCQQVVSHLVQVGSLVCVNEAHHFFKHFGLHVVDFHTILTGEEEEKRRRFKWRNFRNTFAVWFFQVGSEQYATKTQNQKLLSNWGQTLCDSKRAALHVWGKLGFLWDVWGCWENCIWEQAAQQVWEWQQATHTTHGFGQSGNTMDASPRDEEICHCSHLKSL